MTPGEGPSSIGAMGGEQWPMPGRRPTIHAHKPNVKQHARRWDFLKRSVAARVAGLARAGGEK